MTRSKYSSALKAMLILAPAVVAMAGPARACESINGIMCGLPPPEVQAGERLSLTFSVSAKINRALQEAWKLAGAQNFAAAKAKLAPVAALTGKSAADTAAVDSAAAFIAFSLKDFGGAADALADGLAAGAVAPKDVPNRLAALTQLYYQTRNYPKAIEAGERYTREAGPDVDILMIVAQSYYIAKDYAPASRAIHEALAAAAKAGITPKEDWLQVAVSADYYLKDVPSVVANLEQLVEFYPQPKYWKDLLQYAAHGQSDIEVYRLRLAVGVVETTNQYADMAALALGEGLPGEARAVLQRAQAAGLGRGQEAYARGVAAQADDDLKTLANCEADARRQKTGDAEVATGTAYWSYGQYAKASDMIKNGISRGVKDKSRALLRLGLVYAGAGQTDQALQTFALIGKDGADEDSSSARMARLWSIALAHPPAQTTLLAAAGSP